MDKEEQDQAQTQPPEGGVWKAFQVLGRVQSVVQAKAGQTEAHGRHHKADGKIGPSMHGAVSQGRKDQKGAAQSQENLATPGHPAVDAIDSSDQKGMVRLHEASTVIQGGPPVSRFGTWLASDKWPGQPGRVKLAEDPGGKGVSKSDNLVYPPRTGPQLGVMVSVRFPKICHSIKRERPVHEPVFSISWRYPSLLGRTDRGQVFDPSLPHGGGSLLLGQLGPGFYGYKT